MTPSTGRLLFLTAASLGALTLAACQHTGGASQDPDQANTHVQAAMQDYIESHTIDGVTHYYDAVEGRMLNLTYDYLHDGVKKKGQYYVSCADFKDQFGRTLDLDYFVIEADGSYRVTQGLLHKIDGEKRKYDLNAQ